MAMKRPIVCALTTLALLTGAATITAAAAAGETILGHWVLSPELTHAEQPDGPVQKKGWFSNAPRTTVTVGGVPLPGTGGDSGLPAISGSPRDPEVLRCPELTIEAAGEDQLELDYQGVGTQTLERGDDQGLVSRWNDRRLTTRYETTSRKVSQKFELRRDGRLLVTVRLDPNQGATTIHKRVFERAP